MVLLVHETCEMVPISVDCRKVLDQEAVHVATHARTLTAKGNGENLQPDSLDVDTDDVLPRHDRDGLLAYYDERKLPPLEGSARTVRQPFLGIESNPRLNFVLEVSPCRATERCKSVRVSCHLIERRRFTSGRPPGLTSADALRRSGGAGHR